MQLCSEEDTDMRMAVNHVMKLSPVRLELSIMTCSHAQVLVLHTMGPTPVTHNDPAVIIAQHLAVFIAKWRCNECVSLSETSRQAKQSDECQSAS